MGDWANGRGYWKGAYRIRAVLDSGSLDICSDRRDHKGSTECNTSLSTKGV